MPFDRVRGRNAVLVDRPNVTDEAVEDAKWVLKTYEPRVDTENIETELDGMTGDFDMLVTVKKKEEEVWRAPDPRK